MKGKLILFVDKKNPLTYRYCAKQRGALCRINSYSAIRMFKTYDEPWAGRDCHAAIKTIEFFSGFYVESWRETRSISFLAGVTCRGKGLYLMPDGRKTINHDEAVSAWGKTD